MQWVLVGDVHAKLTLNLLVGNLPYECPGLRAGLRALDLWSCHSSAI